MASSLIFRLGIFGWLLLGASFIYAGGCVLNDAFDQKFDQEYNPERPIPSGEINASTVWMVGGVFILIGGSLFVRVGILFHAFGDLPDWGSNSL